MQATDQLLPIGILALALIVLALPMIDGFRGYFGEAGRLWAVTALAMLLGFLATILIDVYQNPYQNPNVKVRGCALAQSQRSKAERT